MDSDRKSVRVTIFNQPYTLAVTGDAADVESLARSVDELMNEISERTGNPEVSRVAVLACLHLADKLRTTDEKTRELSLLLDSVMQ